MRFWKAGGAALILASAAFVMPADAAVREQVTERRGIVQPVQRAIDILTAGGGSRIGVSIDDVDASDVTSKKLAGPSGAVIEDVEDGTPASKAGFKTGDVVLEFDGERVRSARQLTRLIEETPAGRKVAVVISRDGQRMTLSVEPEARERFTRIAPETRWEMLPTPEAPRAPRAPRPPQAPQMFRTPAPRAFAMPTPRIELFRDGFLFSTGGGRLGVSTETVSGQLAKHFGVEHGVLVKEVNDDSAASRAGIRAGDVITKVNGTDIDDTGDLISALNNQSGEVSIGIVRDGKPQTIKVTLEASRARTIRRMI